jgi:aryl-alcohol dehydrogenase-like predicted oxidoreductase
MISMDRISRICFGCEPLGGTDWGVVDRSEIARAIDFALENGVNFFDTADVYGLGMSETLLSDILGERRHDVMIATKGGMAWNAPQKGERAKIRRDSSPKYLKSAVDASLRRLRIDCIPLFYIHWPDEETLISETFSCLAELKDQGKIGRVGCSNFSLHQIVEARRFCEISALQLPVNMLNAPLDPGIQELSIGEKIPIIAYNVLANGLLTGKYDHDSRFPENDRRARLPLFNGEQFKRALDRVEIMRTEAKTLGLSCSQYAINSVLRLPGVLSVIVGIKSVSQLRENVANLLKL